MDNYSKNLKEFSGQFGFQPVVINGDKLVRKNRIIITGMGGSRLTPDIIKMWKPEKEIVVHSDYNLPRLSREQLKDSLVIANSHSGNTEETLDSALKAMEYGLSLAIVAGGGKLIEMAKENSLPYVEVATEGLPPRLNIGRDFLALLKIIGDENALGEAVLLESMDGQELEGIGRKLAEVLKNKIPMIYTSERNMELGYIWKVIMNETAKVPSFCNRFPELNHNEIAGYENAELSKGFHFIFLRDEDDNQHGRIGLRMEKLDEIYGKKDLAVSRIELEGESHLKKIFYSTVLAHWTAYHLAQSYGIDPEKTEIIEEFKKSL